MLSILILCFSLFSQIFAKPFTQSTRSECGYNNCPALDQSQLNVHVVPHSHDDVGWLKTVDQYFYGSNLNTQYCGAVELIISSVVRELHKNPERRFVQVETAFFDKWWSEQNEATRDLVRELVNNGQLEMTGGAWSMNDEADVHYQSTIDQFTLGLRMINDSLGVCGRPKIGWQIDAFGHSREMASLFSQFGFDGLFFARLDWRDKKNRLDEKEMDHIWRGSVNLENTDLFTSVLYNHYSAPGGFCFDMMCSDDPIIDDEEDPDYNYENKVNDYANFIRGQAQYFRTNNIIITMGDDFMYQDANEYFTNMDKLFHGFKLFPQTFDDKPINVFYSTPSCYVKAVHDEAEAKGISFSLKTDDFFPYASDPESVWTGFYTSRSSSKRFERQSNNLYQASKQLAVFTQDEFNGDLQTLGEALGVMQHHDAITGTEKQHVANDYNRILTSAVDKTVNRTNDRLLNLLKKTDDLNLTFSSCLLANVSYCQESSAQRFVVALYNPLSRPVSHYVHIPVPYTDYIVTDPAGKSVDNQITIAAYDFSAATGLETLPYDLVFLAEDLPPMGLKVYEIVNQSPDISDINEDTSQNRFVLGDDTIGAQLDPRTSNLLSLTINGQTVQVENTLQYYLNTNGSFGQSSDAYVFTPAINEATAFDEPKISTYKGNLFDEVHQVYSDWAKQIIRVYKNQPYIEFDWIIDRIPQTENQEGREVISKFTTNINSSNIFYTDSNGREILKRTRNFRPTYNYTDDEPVSGNYYPVTSKIFINNENDDIQFAVLNDRAQGGSSLNSGEIELMIHRSTAKYENAEILDEGLVRGQHLVTFGSISGNGERTAAFIERDLALKTVLAPWMFFAEISDDLGDLMKLEFSGLTKSLPENIHILTLQPWSNGTVLLRLEHILETDDDPQLSVPVTVDLKDLFVAFSISSLRETTLAANQWLEDSERLTWNVEDEVNVQSYNNRAEDDLDDLVVSLKPMQIRTFVATVNFN